MDYKLGGVEAGEGKEWAAKVEYACENVYWLACLGGKRCLCVFSPCLMERKYWFPLEILLQIFQELKLKEIGVSFFLTPAHRCYSFFFFDLKYIPSLVSSADNLTYRLLMLKTGVGLR